MKNRITQALMICLVLTVPGTSYSGEGDRTQILNLHKELLQAHLNNDIESWMESEADEYVVANRGEVSHPTKQQREERLRPYLERTKFSEYRDLIPPEVRVSIDGTLGWLIAQVKVSGVQTMEDGTKEPMDVIWAWIELFEKKDGRWLRVGNVSNLKQ